MSYRLNELERLARLLDDYKIGVEEYEDLKAEILDGSTRTIETPSGLVIAGVPQDHIANGVDSTHNSSSPLVSLEVEQPSDPPEVVASRSARSPAIYRVALGAGIVSVFLGGTIGLLAWATVVVATGALASTKIRKGRWMPWTGLALGILFTLVNLYLNGHIEFGLQETGASPEPSSAAASAPVSLSGGMEAEDLRDNWNELVVANELPPGWELGPGRDVLSYTEYLLRADLGQGLGGGNSRISVKVRLDPTTDEVRTATLHVYFGELVNGAEPFEYDKLGTAWGLFCQAVHGPDGPDCADHVAESLGVPLEQLSDWLKSMNVVPGNNAYWTQAVLNGVEWSIAVDPYAIMIHASTD